MATKIEWSEETWNPVTGCTRVSDGCDHCYIERTMPFRTQHRKFDGIGVGASTGVSLHSERLHKPLSWRRPRRVFVNSLSDLFHERVPDRFIAAVFAVMALAPQHTFQVLTKRHGRMWSLLLGAKTNGLLDQVSGALLARGFSGGIAWPLPNVWIGVSVESQQWADIRIPALLDTPAAVRWISAEPLLGPVNLAPDDHAGHERDWQGHDYECLECSTEDEFVAWRKQDMPPLDWAVIGGESGPGARPMELDWARTLVRQFQAAGTPVFVKQLGSRWGRDHHDISQFPPDLQVREYPEVSHVG